MRISDWSSDVCSSDLTRDDRIADQRDRQREMDVAAKVGHRSEQERDDRSADDRGAHDARSLRRPFAEPFGRDRKSVVYGKRVSVRVALGGRRIIKKHKNSTTPTKYT